MNPLELSYNCCTAGQLPDMSEFEALVICPVLPNANDDGETNCQTITQSELDSLTEEQRSTLFYTLHARTEDGDFEPLHDDADLMALLKMAQALAVEVGLPLELEIGFNGTEDGRLPDMSGFELLEVNAVVTHTFEDGSSECEAMPGIVSGKTPIDKIPEALRETMFYTLYGRQAGTGFAVALHDENNLDLLLEIVNVLEKQTGLPVELN